MNFFHFFRRFLEPKRMSSHFYDAHSRLMQRLQQEGKKAEHAPKSRERTLKNGA